MSQASSSVFPHPSFVQDMNIFVFKAVSPFIQVQMSRGAASSVLFHVFVELFGFYDAQTCLVSGCFYSGWTEEVA